LKLLGVLQRLSFVDAVTLMTTIATDKDTAMLGALRLLAPTQGDLSTILQNATSGACLVEPFSERRINAVDRLSGAIFQHPELRTNSAAVALAFWLRRANVERMRGAALRRDNREIVQVPVGMVFHIAPANVDTMFIYSWTMAFLMGNTNLVRLSTTLNHLVSQLLNVINDEITADPVTWSGNVFLTYEHDDVVTAALSERCDHRVIWGGDETVRRIRKIHLNAHASERAFASKSSASIMSASAVAQLDENGARTLAAKLAVDIEPFQQMGCSSPHIIYWLTDKPENIGTAVASIDGMLAERLERAGVTTEMSAAIKRIHEAFRLAADGLISNGSFFPGLCTVWSKPTASIRDLHIGGGFISHRAITCLDSIPIDQSVQTLSYFGLTNEQVTRLATIGGMRGLDRLVPVGTALSFSPIWDGFMLWNDFSRLVNAIPNS
jgi:hypothetical protein